MLTISGIIDLSHMLIHIVACMIYTYHSIAVHNDDSINAVLPHPGIKQEFLHRLKELQDKGKTWTEAITELRHHTVPDRYTPHPWKENSCKLLAFLTIHKASLL